MKIADIQRHVRLGKGSDIVVRRVQAGRDVEIGNNVTLRARQLVLGDGARIESDVVADLDTLHLGHASRIERGCRLGSMGSKPSRVHIGEHSFLAHDTKLLLPRAVIGDYTAIHNHCLLNGRQPLVLGHNVWIGQNCILNAEERLTIGNNVGIGAYSSVYTHGYFGDLLEGCQVHKTAPVVIEDDVWVLGSYNLISPGVIVGEKALILPGSVITKNVVCNHCVGGSPQRDLTDRIVPYRDVSPREKLDRIQDFVRELLDTLHPNSYEEVDGGFFVTADYGSYRVLFTPEVSSDAALPEIRPLLLFTANWRPPDTPEDVTVFDLRRRQYSRTRSKAEVETLKFLKSYRARFVPRDRPRVSLSDVSL